MPPGTSPNPLSRRRLLALGGGGVLAALAPGRAALAQGAKDWRPSRPIRLVVGFAPGGSADVLARLLQGPAGAELGGSVVVENVVGAGANIAMGQVAKAEPDGHVVGMATVGTHAINPSLYRSRLPFRVPEDFTPVTLLTTQANVVLVNPGVPSGSIGEFVAWAKANPGALYGSAGIGTSNHLAAELMSQRFGLGMTHVPYRGAAPVISDLLAGRIQMTMENIGTASQMAAEGKLKALAVTTAGRSPRLPDLPTLAESGAPGFDIASWQALVAPAGLPAPIQAALNRAFAKALADPTVVERLRQTGTEVAADTRPDALAAYIRSEGAKYADIVAQANVKIE
jgi:tripartite-type tricarboxylate transporter receptor subunit TctC